MTTNITLSSTHTNQPPGVMVSAIIPSQFSRIEKKKKKNTSKQKIPRAIKEYYYNTENITRELFDAHWIGFAWKKPPPKNHITRAWEYLNREDAQE